MLAKKTTKPKLNQDMVNIAIDNNISLATVYRRLNNNWDTYSAITQKTEVKRQGRKSAEKKSKNYNFRVPVSLSPLLENELKERDLNTSEFITELLSNYFNHNQNTKAEEEPIIIENKLTKSQEIAFNEIKEFLNGNNKFFKLKGYAGTGKSFLIVEIVKYLTQLDKKYIIASPTNKAVKNIQKLAKDANINITCSTLAKLLGLQAEINEQNGKDIFISKGEFDITEYDVIFCDEYSMISKDNLELLDKNTVLWQKVIFVGDAAQLPPIGEKTPPVENMDINDIAELLDIVRYNANIAKIAEEIRKESIYDQRLYPFKNTGDFLFCLTFEQWLNKACQMLKKSIEIDNSDYAKILVFRNKTADTLNKAIREYLYGQDCNSYEINDRLIARVPVFRCLNNKWFIVVNTSEELIITKRPNLCRKTLTLSKLKESFTYDYYEVQASYDNGKILLFLLTEESKLQLIKDQQYVKDLIFKKQGNKTPFWAEFQTLTKSFDDCPFAYAITTHKAQGSTIENVFIHQKDFNGCQDLQRIQYTAFTRAKSAIYIT